MWRNPTSIDEYSCPFCQKSFESLFKLELHIESIHHESVFTSEDNISNKVLNENLTCPVCKKPGIRSQTEMTIHVEEVDVFSGFLCIKVTETFTHSTLMFKVSIHLQKRQRISTVLPLEISKTRLRYSKALKDGWLISYIGDYKMEIFFIQKDFSLAQKLFKEEKEIRDRVGQKEFEKLK